MTRLLCVSVAVLVATTLMNVRATPVTIAEGDGREWIAEVTGLEAEHMSLLPHDDCETATPQSCWAPPVLDDSTHLFSWRVQVTSGSNVDSMGRQTAAVARNVTQVSALLTLSTPGLSCPFEKVLFVTVHFYTETETSSSFYSHLCLWRRLGRAWMPLTRQNVSACSIASSSAAVCRFIAASSMFGTQQFKASHSDT